MRDKSIVIMPLILMVLLGILRGKGSWVKILFQPVLQYVVALLFFFPKWYHLSFDPTGFDFMAQNMTHGPPLFDEFYIGKYRQIWQKVRKILNL